MPAMSRVSPLTGGQSKKGLVTDRVTDRLGDSIKEMRVVARASQEYCSQNAHGACTGDRISYASCRSGRRYDVLITNLLIKLSITI